MLVKFCQARTCRELQCTAGNPIVLGGCGRYVTPIFADDPRCSIRRKIPHIVRLLRFPDASTCGYRREDAFGQHSPRRLCLQAQRYQTLTTAVEPEPAALMLPCLALSCPTVSIIAMHEAGLVSLFIADMLTLPPRQYACASHTCLLQFGAFDWF